MASSSRSVPASSSRYDVFLSFRGEDVRKTFVDHLHSALLQQGILVFKDDQTLSRGASIGPSLLKAIEDSKISVIVFSENYAQSSWCLDELVHIMKCRAERGQIVYPVFYHVDPSDVRKQKRKYGEAFEKVENNAKAESWRKALSDATNISGWEPQKMANGHESMGIKEMVNTISEKIYSLMPHADEDLVGMGTRLHYLKSKLENVSGGVHMIGIWGMGGSGKTTLASSLYADISDQFDADCIIDNVREESSKHGLTNLQEKVLFQVLETKVRVKSVNNGRSQVKNRLCGRKVLILLDDVDDVEQLEALAGSHKWFGDGSRIIITTRDEHLLIAHKVDVVCRVSLLLPAEAIRLFNKHAYDQDRPVEDYETLSRRVVSYAAGLPLALKVLGSFLCGRDKSQWMSTLTRLKDIPNTKIVEKLKVSYDGLEPREKELFLDIACFHRGKSKDDVMKILDACGFHPVIGVGVLVQKALITIQYGKFDMHDLLQEMGHYIVRGEHRDDPEKHSRVWKIEEIDNMCLGDATMVNDKTEALVYEGSSSRFPKLVSSMKKLRLLCVSDLYGRVESDVPFEAPRFLSNELRYIDLNSHISFPLPENFHATKLLYLRFSHGLHKELWMGYKLLYGYKASRSSNGVAMLTTFLNKVDSLWLLFERWSQLKFLVLSGCENLDELPELPSNLVILVANNCKSLEVVGGFHTNCKQLSYVSLMKVKIVICGDRLLQTMLQGESHSLSLSFDGLEIPKLFNPLVGGRRCRLQLPENWHNEFSGFLMCCFVKSIRRRQSKNNYDADGWVI